MQDELVCKPRILDLNVPTDEEYFNAISSVSNRYDQLDGQLTEYVKMKFPKDTLTEEFIDYHKRQILGDVDVNKYGLWVFYPWSNKLVHILPKEQFIELRTLRNRYKITSEEQSQLRKKAIGIVGLSVGQTIAITMATERICGELRLADFDRLELTNLNRIKAGIDQIGMLKTVIAARTISEIDPFIHVTCYHDGLNDDNINAFLSHPTQLDLCIEECDSFYEKFNVRYKCKELGIPVVMDTGDMGLLDVERFDLEPDREIFHGLTNVENLEVLRELTTDEKIPYLYSIIDENQMSTRLKGSLIEVGESIRSWPQLSSAVTYGSGMTTDASRRILLGSFTASGRFSLDMESLISDETSNKIELKKHQPEEGQPDVEKFDVQSSDGLSGKVTETLIKKLIADAILAPSGGNAQPWKWESSGNQIVLKLDEQRVSPYTDHHNWGAISSLGCASENLVLSAWDSGFALSREFVSTGEHDFSVKFTLIPKNNAPDFAPVDPTLVANIHSRQTNRNQTPRKPLEESHRSKLSDSVGPVNKAQFHLIEQPEMISELAEVIADGDVIRFLNERLFRELNEEIRWSRKEAIDQPWGIDLDLLDITAKDRIGLKIASSWSVASFVKNIGGRALGDMSRKQLNNSSALALITVPELSPESFFEGGYSIERLWLVADQLGIAVHPFLALNFFFLRLHTGETETFSTSEINTLKTLEKRWRKILQLPNNEFIIFFTKLAYAPRAATSQRIPLEQVLAFK